MNADDAKATIPLPVSPPSDERATVPLPGSDTSTLPPDPSETIGRFVVRGFLGEGAFGQVFRAFDPQLDREVAVKVAKPGSLNTPERLARFLREAKAAANLRHPHIVPLYETGTDGDRRFIVSAFIDGRTLEAVAQEASEAGTPLSLQQVAEVGRRLADALAYAHSQGVVHRDVKPANVLVDASGDPHLLDFGLAAREEEGGERLTQDGQGMGTPANMAPEQADGNGEAASDQYSLGCTLYELATGQTPFAGGPVQQLFLHKTQPVPSPRSLRPDVPKDLDTLILKCLEKEPARRYPTCSELADDLRRFASGEPVKVRRAGPVERLTRWAKRNKKLAGMGLLTLLTILLGSGASLGFGLYANEQAGIAKGETKKAEDSAAGEKQEKENAKVAAAREKEQKENAQRSLAKSLLGPISPNFGEFSPYERNAMWELAALRQTPLSLMFLTEATGSELAAAQFRNRAAYLDHAAVGLDSLRRQEADALLARRLSAPAISPARKCDVVLGMNSAERYGVAEDMAEVLATRVAKTTDWREGREFVVCLAEVTAALPPEKSVAIVGPVASRLATALVNATFHERGELSELYRLVASQLPAEETARLLAGALAKAKTVDADLILTMIMAGDTTSGTAEKLAAVVDVLIIDFGTLNYRARQQEMALKLAAVASQLPKGKRIEVCTKAAELFLADLKSGIRGKVHPVETAQALAKSLDTLFQRIPSEQAVELCSKTAEAIVAELSTNKNEYERRALAAGLTAVVSRIPEDRAEKLAGKLTNAIALAPDGMELHLLAEGLAALSWRLSADNRAKAHARAVESLVTARGDPRYQDSRRELAAGLARISKGISEDKATVVASVLADAIKSTEDPIERMSLVEALGSVAPKLTAEVAVKMAETLTAELRELGFILGHERRVLAEGIARLACRMPSEQGMELCRQTEAVLVAALKEAVVGQEFLAEGEGLAKGLASLASQLPEDRSATAETLVATIELGQLSRSDLVDGLAAVVSGLSSNHLTHRKHSDELAALAGILVLHPAVLPKPRPLPPQQLVELLKHPFCVKEARRAVLDALEFTYDRKFADLWEFVAFAEKEHPELDLLTSPNRLERVLPKADAKPK